MKAILIFFVTFLFLISINVHSQTIGQQYDLNFQQFRLCGWDWMEGSRCSQRSFDKTVWMDNRHPLLFSYTEEIELLNVVKTDCMSFVLSKVILLPKDIKGDSLQVTLVCKTQNTSELEFKIVALDEREVRLDLKSIKIDHMEWDSQTLSLPFLNMRAIVVQIKYVGSNSPEQRIWLDKISIEVDGEDLSGYMHLAPSDKDSLLVTRRLNAKQLIPLSFADDHSLLNKIDGLNGKKIIGLGEFCHGSYEVTKAKFQFCKNLINSYNCKMILMELSQNETFLYNLYVQNLISEEFLGKVEHTLRNAFLDYELYLDFIEWLRNYNKTVQEKVFLLGIDEDSTIDSHGNLYSYFISLLGEERSTYYLTLVIEKKYKEILERVKSDEVLQDKIGSKNTSYLFSVLEELVMNTQRDGAGFVQRDSLMADRAEKVVSVLLEKKQKCVIFAHSGHVSKIVYHRRSYYQQEFTIGEILKAKYGEKYLVISFQAGEGTVLDEECFLGGMVFEASLPLPPYYSFEHAAMNMKNDYFYYPTRYLNNDIVQLSYISRPNIGRDYYGFASPKERFDAIVFIRKTTPLRNVNFPVVKLNSNSLRK